MKAMFANMLLVIFASSLGFAQESTISIKINSNTIKAADVLPEKTTSDIDEKITDARMRTALGSKSKWSFKSNFNYAGGSLSTPMSRITPNYRKNSHMESMSSITGGVGLNYRLTEADSFGVGTGILMVAPLHGSPAESVDDERNNSQGKVSRYQVSSPYVDYKKGYLAFDTMMMSSLSYHHSTDNDSVNLMKSVGRAMFFQMAVKNLGTTRWSVGGGLMYIKIFYSGDVSDPKLMMASQMGLFKRPDEIFGAIPFVQYAINDRFSLKSEFMYFQFMKYEGSSESIQEEPAQTIGTGISITRDIYLYPNIQFAPKDIRTDRTNVALNANINLF